MSRGGMRSKEIEMDSRLLEIVKVFCVIKK